MTTRAYSMSWKPALAPPPSPLGKHMGRSMGEKGALTAFVDSPELAALTDIAAASASAYFAYGLGRVQNKWSTFWWVISAGATIKLLHDVSRI